MIRSNWRLLLCLALPLTAGGLAAQTASLVSDLTVDNGSSTSSSAPADLTPFRGKLLFSATQGGSGRELWVSEGDDKGTHQLADFCPGECDSNPRVLGATNAAVFGSYVIHGDSFGSLFLWRSDGTRGGTFPLPDAADPVRVPDPTDLPESSSVYTAVLGNVFYFPGCSHEQGCGLWRSDGTTSGTWRILDSGGNYPYGLLAAAGNRVYLAVGGRLSVTDGTVAGTRTLLQRDSFIDLPTGFGGKLYFLSTNATGDSDLWVSDGTVEGTRPVKSFAVPSPFSQTRFLKAMGGKLYFVVDDVLHGAELWTSDGTQAGTRPITEFGFHDPFGAGEDPFDESGLPAGGVEALGNRIVFWATDGIHGFQPWSTTGTPESTTPLCPACSFSNIGTLLVKVGTHLLFVARETTHGSEYWATDGTPQGTVLLKDLCAGPCDGARWPAVPVLGAAFLPALGDGRSSLWVSDGTSRGTRRYATPGAYANGDFGEGPAISALGTTLYYAGGDRFTGYGVELWASDGSPAGTRPVTDIARGNGSSEFDDLVAAGRDLYFITCNGGRRFWHTGGSPETTLRASSAPGGCNTFGTLRGASIGSAFLFPSTRSFETGPQIWRMNADGTLSQLSHLDVPGKGHFISDLAPLGERVVFAVSYQVDQVHDRSEIWVSDGTAAGTAKAADLPANVVDPYFFTVVGSEIWFSVYDTAQGSGSEMWRTDGTAAGTRLAVDLGEGRTVTDPMFTKAGATVYLVGADPDGTRQIWRSDGTPAGSARVRNLDPFPNDEFSDAIPADLTALGGTLYFSARTSQGRSGFWRTDGTEQGTVLLKDFVEPGDGFTPDYDGEYWPSPLDLKAVGSWLVFAADDGHGRELWRSDGTVAGTTVLRDLRLSDALDLHVTDSFFQSAAGRLYFAANDGVHGYEPWQTDGTPEGTRMVQDIAPESASSSPQAFTAAEDRLFFTVDDGVAGRELWVLPLSGAACQASGSALCLAGGRFEVKVAWRDFAGHTGAGHAVPLSGDTGYFWFFDAANVETVVKMLDGTGTNGHYWVFFGALSNVEYTVTVTDTRTGATRRYFNPQGVFASVGDTQGFGPLGASAMRFDTVAGAPPLVEERRVAAAATGTCVPAAARLCLNGGRFAVEAAWKDFSNHTGIGTAVPLSGDTGYFWFFAPANVEAVVKVLDGTAVNGHFWLFYGALSNVEYTLTVTDTMTGKIKTYTNPKGRFASVGDTEAF